MQDWVCLIIAMVAVAPVGALAASLIDKLRKEEQARAEEKKDR